MSKVLSGFGRHFFGSFQPDYTQPPKRLHRGAAGGGGRGEREPGRGPAVRPRQDPDAGGGRRTERGAGFAVAGGGGWLYSGWMVQ